jgi:hypothetical protein
LFHLDHWLAVVVELIDNQQQKEFVIDWTLA